MNLQGKTIVITGGQRVGRVVARELARHKASLVMTYLHSPDEVEPALDDMRASGGQGHSVQLDLRDGASVIAFTQRLERDFPQIDALIHMAAVFMPDTQKIEYEDIVNLFSINAFGAMVLSRWFAERARARQDA
jgi:NAD(P)-dependent dehydrogenase (short-subunit alcohol dehydrogenase family)